ncbi:MAG: hypothetical protein AB4058_06915 [Microcystaceae cyanobacterium]
MAQEQKNWQKRLEELEKEVNQTFETTPLRLENTQSTLEKAFSRLQAWYQPLPTPVKAIVAVGGVLVALSLFNTVLKLVTSLVSLGILVLVGYGVYKFVVKSNAEES